MNKHNLFIKKLQQRVLSINNSIESYFNQLRFFKKNFKKNEFIRNNRVFFGISAVAILTLSYFLVPTMYNKNIIQEEIKNQIFKKYKIEVIFNEKFLPRRGRINCSMQDKDGWKWFGTQFTLN